MEINEIVSYFPLSTPRPCQILALEKFVETTNKERKFTILEMPTGSGKSAISMTLAQWSHSAYILTIQKILQIQMMRDFESNGLIEMKGGSNYKCGKYPVHCDQGAKLAKAMNNGSCDCICPYKTAKEQFLHSPFGITNFSYFLTMMTYQEGLLPNRKLLIIDEAHNTEAALINHSNIEVTRADLGELQISFPNPPLGPFELDRTKEWLTKVVFPACSDRRKGLRMAIEDARRDPRGEKRMITLLQEESSLDSFQSKLSMFFDSESKMWFVGHSDKIEIKPLRGDLFANDLLFKKADHVIFLSATILDPRTFVRNLGISPKQCGYLGVPSEFPKENRRIIFTPAGSMSFKNYDATLPKLLNKIERILAKHSNEKGIIHCQSFKTVKNVMSHFKGTPFERRLLSHDSTSRSKNYAIDAHMTKSEPTVLLSPSMTEGLDLRDDLSRFQVVCKAPFGSLASPYIKTRMALDPDWYMWCACLDLVQGTGRSIRSKDDYAVTYLIDSDINRLLSSGVLPDWWTDAVEFR